ncbi:MAG: hypothetical protein PHD76_00615 [Methylacidiphilales bacterium]|nr:hypothetical protein [Candidatus Methylacidiphilales bacterium]
MRCLEALFDVWPAGAPFVRIARDQDFLPPGTGLGLSCFGFLTSFRRLLLPLPINTPIFSFPRSVCWQSRFAFAGLRRPFWLPAGISASDSISGICRPYGFPFLRI